MNKLLATAAMAVITATASMANAAVEDKKSTQNPTDEKPTVKCYGVAVAGKNDCASADGSHSCAGHAKADKDKNEFRLVTTKEECEKAGGKVADATTVSPVTTKN